MSERKNTNLKKGIKGFISVPLEERFWPKLIKRGDDECWLWIGSKDDKGYGQIWVNRRNRKATQISWELANGQPFPPGKMACHKCDNPPCVNPNHLFVGTMSDNIKDARAKNRHKVPHEMGFKGSWQSSKTHCLRGHELAGENLYITSNGGRACRVCLRASKKKYAQRKLARAALDAQPDKPKAAP